MAHKKKERLGLTRRYTFKLYPSPSQERALIEQCRMMAQLWNALLEMNETAYRRAVGGKGICHIDGAKSHLSFFDMTALITELRAECPEWAVLSVYSPHRVAFAIDNAFRAFFARAKKGAGAQSGYPRFKRVADARWLPHRFKSGCVFHAVDAKRRNWRLKLKGIEGRIRARGEFPLPPLAFNDADIRFYAGTWWLSVGCELPARRAPGSEPIEIDLRLADEFAVVKTAADGGLASAALPDFAVGQSGKTGSIQRDQPGSPADAGESSGVQGRPAIAVIRHLPADAGESSGVQGNEPDIVQGAEPAETGNRLQAERDIRYPRQPGKRRSRRAKKFDLRISKLKARETRQRREKMHEWTSAIVAQARSLKLTAPAGIKEITASAKGDQKRWGAAVKVRAAVNRRVLDMAPAAAIQMLEYKAREASIEFEIIRQNRLPEMTQIAADLSATVKVSRKARRKAKEIA